MPALDQDQGIMEEKKQDQDMETSVNYYIHKKIYGFNIKFLETYCRNTPSIFTRAFSKKEYEEYGNCPDAFNFNRNIKSELEKFINSVNLKTTLETIKENIRKHLFDNETKEYVIWRFEHDDFDAFVNEYKKIQQMVNELMGKVSTKKQLKPIDEETKKDIKKLSTQIKNGNDRKKYIEDHLRALKKDIMKCINCQYDFDETCKLCQCSGNHCDVLDDTNINMMAPLDTLINIFITRGYDESGNTLGIYKDVSKRNPYLICIEKIIQTSQMEKFLEIIDVITTGPNDRDKIDQMEFQDEYYKEHFVRFCQIIKDSHDTLKQFNGESFTNLPKLIVIDYICNYVYVKLYDDSFKRDDNIIKDIYNKILKILSGVYSPKPFRVAINGKYFSNCGENDLLTLIVFVFQQTGKTFDQCVNDKGYDEKLCDFFKEYKNIVDLMHNPVDVREKWTRLVSNRVNASIYTNQSAELYASLDNILIILNILFKTQVESICDWVRSIQPVIKCEINPNKNSVMLNDKIIFFFGGHSSHDVLVSKQDPGQILEMIYLMQTNQNDSDIIVHNDIQKLEQSKYDTLKNQNYMPFGVLLYLIHHNPDDTPFITHRIVKQISYCNTIQIIALIENDLKKTHTSDTIKIIIMIIDINEIEDNLLVLYLKNNKNPSKDVVILLAKREKTKIGFEEMSTILESLEAYESVTISAEIKHEIAVVYGQDLSQDPSQDLSQVPSQDLSQVPSQVPSQGGSYQKYKYFDSKMKYRILSKQMNLM
jgi:hypothetical protein